MSSGTSGVCLDILFSHVFFSLYSLPHLQVYHVFLSAIIHVQFCHICYSLNIEICMYHHTPHISTLTPTFDSLDVRRGEGREE